MMTTMMVMMMMGWEMGNVIRSEEKMGEPRGKPWPTRHFDARIDEDGWREREREGAESTRQASHTHTSFGPFELSGRAETTRARKTEETKSVSAIVLKVGVGVGSPAACYRLGVQVRV
jgi:hypothetical protein